MRLARVRLLFSLLSLAALAEAQVPKIATIQIFGYRQTPISQIQGTLHLKPGDPLPASKADLEEKLQELPHIAQATLEAVCCEAGKAILYVGVREKDAPVLALYDEPDGNSSLPAEVIEAYGRFLRSLNSAGEKGETAEDLSRGHSLIQNEEARRAQMAFIPLAEQHILALKLVLRDSASEEQRAISAYVLGYHPDKKMVAPLLHEALHDIDETVRTNAARAITALAAYAVENPNAGFQVDPSPFLVMLHSSAWQERNNAAHCLTTMTSKRDPDLLRKVREQDFEPLREMAKWKPTAHAWPAWLLLGRIKGLDDKAIQDLWKKEALARVIP